ncbi:hypothetical protein [Tepidimonas charontis]|nr:hypothetical protein [Tepidimonas charontis]
MKALDKKCTGRRARTERLKPDYHPAPRLSALRFAIKLQHVVYAIVR